MSKYERKMKSLGASYIYEKHQEDKPRVQPTQEDILRIEREIKSELPDNYTDFLINYGGFVCKGYCYPLSSESKAALAIVNVFFGYLTDGYDLLDAWHTYKDEEDLRMPRSFLPIATDPGGNMFCLSLFGEDEGKVYFWDHELEEMPEPGEEPGYSNVTLLANSFDEFIDSLTLRPHP
jgi:hypothetical protein